MKALLTRGRALRHRVRLGPVVFCDPLLLCGVLYVLLWLDASGFLRLGLAAAALHELGHIIAYILITHRMPVIAVTMAGFCMRTRNARLTPAETLCLAAAGPGMNAVLAAIWAAKMSRCATVRGSAFLAANILTGAFNLLPVPPLDGAQLLGSGLELWRGRSAAARGRAGR